MSSRPCCHAVPGGHGVVRARCAVSAFSSSCFLNPRGVRFCSTKRRSLDYRDLSAHEEEQDNTKTKVPHPTLTRLTITLVCALCCVFVCLRFTNSCPLSAHTQHPRGTQAATQRKERGSCTCTQRRRGVVPLYKPSCHVVSECRVGLCNECGILADSSCGELRRAAVGGQHSSTRDGRR